MSIAVGFFRQCVENHFSSNHPPEGAALGPDRKRSGLLTKLPGLLILALVCSGIVSCSPPTKEESSGDHIPYEVLKKRELAGIGKFDMHILVKESALKETVMNLAEWLNRKYAGEYLHIFIYDSRETWRRWDDDSYPEKERDLHLLVVMDALRFEKKVDIRWVAEGRDH
jgi:hypothetical protein